MFGVCLIFGLFVCVSQAGYAGPYGGNYVGGNPGGSGYGFSGAGFPPYAPPFYPQPPIPYDFNSLMAGLSQLQSRIQQQAAYVPNLSNWGGVGGVEGGFGAGNGNGGAYAYSGSYPAPPPYMGNPIPPVVNGHQGGFGGSYGSGSGFGGAYGGGYGGAYGGAYGGGNGGGYGYGGSYGNGYKKDPMPLSLGAFQGVPNIPSIPSMPSISTYSGRGGYGAGATASIGPGGVEQKAFLNPGNPASPNVNVRFAAVPPNPNGSSKSVYVSSSSASGNINGTPYHQRHASSTVNDNGRVSSYAVHDK